MNYDTWLHSTHAGLYTSVFTPIGLEDGAIGEYVIKSSNGEIYKFAVLPASHGGHWPINAMNDSRFPTFPLHPEQGI